MAVHIRLARKGQKSRPVYWIVAADHRAARDGRYLEKLGTHDPNSDAPATLERERIEYWLKQGAQVSPVVKSLLRSTPEEAAPEAA